MAEKRTGFSFGEVYEDSIGERQGLKETSFFQANVANYLDNTLQSGVAGMMGEYEKALLKKRAQDTNQELLEPGELNKMFPGLAKPFFEPQYRNVAQFMAAAQNKHAQLQRKVAAGPQGGLYSAGYFTSGLMAHAADPVNLGVSILSGGAAGLALNGTKFGAAIGYGLRSPGLVKGFYRGAIDGTIGNILAEPFSMAAANNAGVEFSLGETAINGCDQVISRSLDLKNIFN